jgi:hypothetical protein
MEILIIEDHKALRRRNIGHLPPLRLGLRGHLGLRRRGLGLQLIRARGPGAGGHAERP